MFWPKVHITVGCWHWRGAKGKYGHAFWQYAGRGISAYRYSYKQLRGIIPEGLVLDHLCKNPMCVNPWHLEPVAQRTNIERGSNPVAQKMRQTHCIRGHQLSGDNLYIKPKSGTRCCKLCKSLRQKGAL